MYLNLVESNPQLFRELTSRLKPAYITLSVTISFTGQIFCLMLFGNLLRDPTPQKWQEWFSLNFISLSGVGIFALLVVGSYLLITDLSKEEEKNTLNALRLSPESARNILIGKMLGVPIHLYLVAILALPLHAFSGWQSGVSIGVILGFYAVLISSCIFFYSLALLFALVPVGKGYLKAGLFSAVLVLKLLFSFVLIDIEELPIASLNWISCFNPWLFLNLSVFNNKTIGIDWFGIPTSSSAIALGIFLIGNYLVWAFWIWQGLDRWFHNPMTNLFTKAQSYGVTASWQIILLGFASQVYTNKDVFWANFCVVMLFDLALYFVLIGVLTPHHQTMQEWSRYRHYGKFGRKNQLWQDLVLGEKSPAIVAVGINAILASLILVPWILQSSKFNFVASALQSLAIAIALTLIYALMAQLVFLTKNLQKRFLTAATLVGTTMLPPVFAIANSSHFHQTAWIWLFSIFPWVGFSITNIPPLALLATFCTQSLGIALLSLQLTNQVKALGVSQTKSFSPSTVRG